MVGHSPHGPHHYLLAKLLHKLDIRISKKGEVGHKPTTSLLRANVVPLCPKLKHSIQ